MIKSQLRRRACHHEYIVNFVARCLLSYLISGRRLSIFMCKKILTQDTFINRIDLKHDVLMIMAIMTMMWMIIHSAPKTITPFL